MTNKYEIIEELGRGGMGVVYKARDTSIQRIVAIKTLLQMSPNAITRFFREMRAMSQIEHPNIIRLYEVGNISGRHYYSMEYIEGQDLAKYSKSNELSFREMAKIMAKVARAIHVVHEKGIIHRDLKPQNILLDNDKNPYLMDFGLAKAMDCDGDLTKSAQILGTPFYMSPEQAKGKLENIDHQSDIYALGVILYQLMTKEKPYTATSIMDLFAKITAANFIPPRKRNEQIPQALEAICLKAMANNKEDRYEHADLLARDLEKYLRGRKNIQAQKKSQSVKMLILTFITVTLCAIYFILTRDWNFPSSLNITLGTKEQIVNSQNLRREGLFEEAKNILREIHSKDSSNQMATRLLFATYVDLKEFSKAQKYLEKITNQEHPLVCLHIAKMYFAEEKFTACEQNLQKSLKNDTTKNESLYYLGRLKFSQQNYTEASEFFKRVDTEKWGIHKKDVTFYLGKSLIAIKNHKKALQYLTQLDTPSITLYQAIAECYTKENDLGQARKYWGKCLELQPDNSEFFTRYAQTLYHEKKYVEANNYFLKAIDLDPQNWEAFSGVLEISHYYPSLNWENNIYILNSFNTIFHSYPFDIQKYYLKQVVDKNKQGYLTYQQLKNKQGNATLFLDSLVSSQAQHTAIRGLFSLRHISNIESTVENYVKNLSENKRNKIMQVWSIVTKRRIVERKQYLYYQLAQEIMYPDRNNTLEKNLVLQIFKDKEQPAIHRYAAARNLLKNLHIKDLKAMTKNRKDLPGALISSIVLRQANYRQSLPQISQKQKNELETFLRFIIIDTTKNDDYLYQEMKQQQNIPIKVCAASRLVFKNQYNVKEEVRQTLISCMNKDIPRTFELCAHISLWKSLYIPWENENQRYKQEFKYRDILFRLLDSDDLQIKLAAMRYPMYYNINGYQNKIAQLADHHEPFVQHSALFNLSHTNIEHPVFSKIIDSESYHFSLRSLSFLFAYLHSIKGGGMFKILQKVKLIERKMPRWSQDSDPRFRGIVTLLSSFFGYRSLPILEKENDLDVKVFWLLGLRMPSYLPQHKIAVEKKLAIAEKYIKSNHDDLRTAAYLLKLSFTDPKEWEAIYQEVSIANKSTMKGVANALIYIVQNLIGQRMHQKDRFSFFYDIESYRRNYLDTLKGMVKNHQISAIKAALLYSDRLHPLPRISHLLAVLESLEGKYDKAISYYQIAIKQRDAFSQKCELAVVYSKVGQRQKLRKFLTEHFSQEIPRKKLKNYRAVLQKIADKAIEVKCYKVARNILRQLLRIESHVDIAIGIARCAPDAKSKMILLKYGSKMVGKKQFILKKIMKYPELRKLNTKEIKAIFR